MTNQIATFDFNCNGKTQEVVLAPGLTISIDGGCGEIEEIALGGRDVCTDKTAHEEPHIYLIAYALTDGSSDVWTFDYFSYDGELFTWGYDGDNIAAPIERAQITIVDSNYCRTSIFN